MCSILPFFVVPGGPPINVVALNITDYSVQLMWQPPRLPNGVITHYNIYIDDSQTPMRTNTNGYLLTGLTQGITVNISVSANTSIGEGPRSPGLIVTIGVTDASSAESRAAAGVLAGITITALVMVLCAIVGVIVAVVVVKKKYYNKQTHR